MRSYIAYIVLIQKRRIYQIHIQYNNYVGLKQRWKFCTNTFICLFCLWDFSWNIPTGILGAQEIPSSKKMVWNKIYSICFRYMGRGWMIAVVWKLFLTKEYNDRRYCSWIIQCDVYENTMVGIIWIFLMSTVTLTDTRDPCYNLHGDVSAFASCQTSRRTCRICVLMFCNITSLDVNALSCFKSAYAFNLRYNHLKYLPVQIFKDMMRLKILDISGEYTACIMLVSL